MTPRIQEGTVKTASNKKEPGEILAPKIFVDFHKKYVLFIKDSGIISLGGYIYIKIPRRNDKCQKPENIES